MIYSLICANWYAVTKKLQTENVQQSALRWILKFYVEKLEGNWFIHGDKANGQKGKKIEQHYLITWKLKEDWVNKNAFANWPGILQKNDNTDTKSSY